MTTTEDDDDEGFGEFTFAPITVHSNPKINGSGHHGKVDDDWGDFVTPASLSRCETLPVKSLDPINLSSDRRTDSLKTDAAQPDSAPSRIRDQWEKPKGALPLSLFGEEEKEDDSGAPGLLFNGAPELKKTEKKMGSELNASYLISNLYLGSEQSKVGNRSGLNLDSNGLDLKRSAANLDSNGSALKLENWGSYGLNSDSKGLDLKRSVSNLEINGSGLKLENWGSYGLNLDSKGLDLMRSVSTLGLNGLDSKINLDSNGLNSGLDEDDDDGWEFKAAETKLPNGDFNFKSQHEVKAENVLMPKVDGLKSSWNAHLNGLSSSVNGVNKDANGFSSSLVDKSEDFGDDDEWEFKDAETEPWSADSNNKVNNKGPGNSEGVKHTFVFDNGAQVPTDLFTVSNGISQKPGQLDFGLDFSKSSVSPDGIYCSFSNSEQKNDNGAQVPTDLFASSNGISQKSGQLDFGFDLSKSSVAPDGISSSLSNSEQKNDNENGLNSASVIGNVENGENLWEFKDAFSETGSKDRGKDTKLESHRGALPLSLFGDGDIETNDSSIHQDVPNYNLASSTTDDIKKSQGSSVSISDLITSLYSQAEQNTPVNHTQNPSEKGFNSVQKVVDSNLADGDGDGDFDDDSWEFKGAVSRTVDDQISVPGLGDSHVRHSTKVEPKKLIEQKDYADFYSELEDELLFVAQYHLDNLKKERSTAALCGEDGKLEAIDKEIQDLYNELHQDCIISKVHPENRPLSNIHLNEFIEVLQEPTFHVLESEYHLSMRLSLAEKDWRSAIELLKHAASTSKILKLGSREEQCSYVSTWFKMVSVCAQELRHGALIWKQSLEKNVSSQLLSDPRGKQYILALGEIYRVVEVLGSSAKLYKPLMLLSSADPTGMFTLLSECFTLWSSSGLDEAIGSISDLTGFECNVTPKELLESIKYIHDLDVNALHNHVFSGQDPTCRLSLLAAGTMPDMKIFLGGGLER
ncbi:uncharacterized protein LOC116139819, partial [Pistacia vera]|uniref:uncharacterized protein LOC116139819 n=1 Tax=Pistacia vera TaxID=55513 RepID=UPI0012631C21